jgi:hypothetical protein
MYVSPNFKTKKALKEAVARGDKVIVFNPGSFCGPTYNGVEFVEGPHYPEPHRWYAEVTIKNAHVTGVK